MPRIVMDEVLRQKLQGADHGVEIEDEQGNVIGHFVAEDSISKILEVLYPPLTDAERAEARKEMRIHGGMSTKQLLDSLAEAKRKWEALR